MTQARRNSLPRRGQTIETLSRAQLRFLEYGRDFFKENPLSDPQQYKAAWEIYERKHLAEFIEQNPGTRPHAWWRLVAKETRRIVGRGGKLRPVDGCPFDYFGGPSCFAPAPEGEGVIIETQMQYLKRLGLLVKGEAEAAAQKESAS